MTVSAQADRARIVINDDGPGIPEALHARVRQPFVRLDDARAAGGGIGMALSIADALVQAHGGRLELANRRGADNAVIGLRVCVELPTTAAQAPACPAQDR